MLIGRLVFMAFFAEAMINAGFRNFFGSILFGLRLDLSIAAYYTAPVCIAIIFSVFFNVFRKFHFYLLYSFLLLVLAFLIITIDIGSYQAWGTKIDPGFLTYLKTPKEAFASIKNFPLLPVFAGFIIFCIFSFIHLKRYFSKACKSRLLPVSEKFKTFAALVCVSAALIIPMRGGLQGLPVNQSSVYFSENNFSNIAAINANFNFFFNLFQGDASNENPFIVMSKEDAEKIAASYFTTSKEKKLPPSDLFKTDSATNIIVIIWESFTQKAITASVGDIEVTPKFNQLKKEGIYFSNIYATGDRTDKGIPGILSGYPAQPTTSILKIPAKAQSLPIISNEFSKLGYYTSFFYGGKGDFANMNAYLAAGNFNNLQTFDDLEIDNETTNWGYHDGDVKDKITAGFPKIRQPFFLTWLTLTSHQPYKTPVPTVIKGDDELSLFFNSLHYTDEVIDQFVQNAKTQVWWHNSLVVIVADHGHRLPATGSKFDDFRIPVLFLGGAVQKPGLTVDKVGSQTDIAATLMDAVGVAANPFKFSNNLFDSFRKPIAYFSFMNGFGLINGDQKFIFDNVGKQIVEQSSLLSNETKKIGSGLQQYFFQDFLKR